MNKFTLSEVFGLIVLFIIGGTALVLILAAIVRHFI